MSIADESLSLVRLSTGLGDAYLAMVDEFEAIGEGYPYNNIALARRDFPAFVRELEDEERGIGLPPGIAPQTTYVLVQGGRTVLGEIRFRPQTTPPFGVGRDHIGYNVRPSRRRRGYASRMLRQVLREARSLGLPGVALTVEGKNPGSVRTIEKHAGQLERQTRDPEGGTIVSQYWVAL